jgi:hypothetical protein
MTEGSRDLEAIREGHTGAHLVASIKDDAEVCVLPRGVE